MARIRSIKPEFCVSEQLAECSANARLVFALMWMFCDDQGIHPAKCRTLKGEIFPLDENITTADVQSWISELITIGLLREYEINSERYWIVTGWAKHQKIDKPSRKYPAPLAEPSPNPPRASAEPSPPEGKGRESKGVEGNKQPPEKQRLGVTSIPAEEPPLRASDFPKPDDPRVTALQGFCIGMSLRARPLEIQQWIADGVTEEILRAAIDRHRVRKPGQALGVPFLQLMIADVRTAGVGYDADAVIAETIAAINAKDAHATH